MTSLIDFTQQPLDHWKSMRVPEKHLLQLTDNARAFDCVDHNKLWKILKEMGVPDHLTCLLRNLMQVKLQLELDIEQETGSKLGKEYVKAVYCQFSSVQSLSCVWLCDPMNHSMPGLSVQHQPPEPKLMSIESVMPSNHLILCCPLLLLPQSFPASGSFPMSQLLEGYLIF